jgi:hypothetical protein
MSARDAEAEHRTRQSVISARLSAGRLAKRAAAARAPLEKRTPPSPGWRPVRQERELDKLWEEATDLSRDRMLAAGASSPQQQDTAPLYGSQRPLSQKERSYQLQKAMERRERRRRDEMSAQQSEQQAAHELEVKRRKHDRLRAKQRSARGAGTGGASGLSRAERKEIQQRLYATPRRELTGNMYA